MIATKPRRRAEPTVPVPRDQLEQKVRELAATGMSDGQIGAVTGHPVHRIRTTRDRHGIPAGGVYRDQQLAAAYAGDTVDPQFVLDAHLRQPAPLDRSEPQSHMRMQQLMLAEHHGVIGQYVGPVDAVDTDPSEWRFYYMPAGMTVADLKPGQLPMVYEPDEVLATIYNLGRAKGLAHVFRYRDGLPE